MTEPSERSAQLEPRFSSLLPEVLLGLGPQEFAALATRAMAPRPAPVVVVGSSDAEPDGARDEAGADEPVPVALVPFSPAPDPASVP